MKILLYNPDNGVTRNFMPHLWMFLLQALTPFGHEVVLIDGNAQPMDEEGIARYVREQNVGLVGIGAMTRMIAKAYRMADAVRAAGVKVVMGGPHVTEMADEAFGRDGGARHADAVAIGEADETWPRIVEDAVRGALKDVYATVDDFGQERKPTLQPYPEIPWDKIDLKQFNVLPGIVQPLLKRVGEGWGTFRIIPVESGRGCPYGCEFCTVTGFFGDSIRFRTNESVVNELLRLKARAREEGGQIAVFWIDDAAACDATVQKAGSRRAAHPSKALARVYSVCDGAYAAEDEHRRGSHGGAHRMGQFLQSRGHREGGGIGEPQAAGVSHQYPYRPPVLPGNLFSANGAVRLAEGDSGKPAHNFQTDQAGIRGGAARRGADHDGPDDCRAAELSPKSLPRKIVGAGGCCRPRELLRSWSTQ